MNKEIKSTLFEEENIYKNMDFKDLKEYIKLTTSFIT